MKLYGDTGRIDAFLAASGAAGAQILAVSGGSHPNIDGAPAGRKALAAHPQAKLETN